jgi:hypothetical protein
MTHLLVVVGDLLSNGHGVLQSSKPELGDTLDIGTLLGRLLLLFLIVLIIGVGSFTSFNITIGRLGFTGDNSLSSFVQWSVFTEELIISIQILRTCYDIPSSRVRGWRVGIQIQL